ncbi:cobalamin biosynthesis protein CbiD [Sedimentibacter sp. zth1]|uniref:cobalt-precorrin-5B (C(1))-methyltransferase CbiD n=1 Tax=Sedimentibacter sp. zth1 TaxID=2816908 RepID=UPI001A923905|nr:cobalt-precorrin-5B (C(1))-methyltransferase CbiD [Sedimentibacter sp. zth1]QSX05351.1 cobalamin biosynthesis protein CbiD [Sedimentibacter sp. zth1]
MLREYITKDGKKLRLGYTTGSCATAASKAAAIMLLTNEKVERVKLHTPKGIDIDVEIHEVEIYDKYVSCAVRKDSGDDIDATRDMLIYAKVSTIPKKAIVIDGGIGIGRVTMSGLNQPVGQAAINSVPRRMIEQELNTICDEYNYEGGFSVIISAPEGENIAKRTFNSRLGIVGGISILGTSGIVEPMSEIAIIDTIKAELNVKKAQNRKYAVLTPGNYGQDFLNDNFSLLSDESVKCSNYIGEAIDYAYSLGYNGVLLVGHIGKIVKLAGGIFNTHSKYGDCRAELIGAHSVLCGANTDTVKQILSSVTTDDMLQILDRVGLKNKVIESLLDKIYFNVNRRVFEECDIAVVTFSQKLGYLGSTKNTDEIIKQIKGELG